jgi:hypothetical protein
MAQFSERFPWPVSILLTALVYLLAIGGLWLIPCEAGFLIGLCEFSRLAFSLIGLMVFLAFLGITYGQRFLVRKESTPEQFSLEFNRRIFLQMVFFCLLAAAFYISILFDKP